MCPKDRFNGSRGGLATPFLPRELSGGLLTRHTQGGTKKMPININPTRLREADSARGKDHGRPTFQGGWYANDTDTQKMFRHFFVVDDLIQQIQAKGDAKNYDHVTQENWWG